MLCLPSKEEALPWLKQARLYLQALQVMQMTDMILYPEDYYYLEKEKEEKSDSDSDSAN